jgi:hypothetical protein
MRWYGWHLASRVTVVRYRCGLSETFAGERFGRQVGRGAAVPGRAHPRDRPVTRVRHHGTPDVAPPGHRQGFALDPDGRCGTGARVARFGMSHARPAPAPDNERSDATPWNDKDRPRLIMGVLNRTPDSRRFLDPEQAVAHACGMWARVRKSSISAALDAGADLINAVSAGRDSAPPARRRHWAPPPGFGCFECTTSVPIVRRRSWPRPCLGLVHRCRWVRRCESGAAVLVDAQWTT